MQEMLVMMPTGFKNREPPNNGFPREKRYGHHHTGFIKGIIDRYLNRYLVTNDVTKDGGCWSLQRM